MNLTNIRFGALRLALLFLLLGTLFSDLVFPDTIDLARQNPTLRNYFLRQHLTMMSYTDLYGRTYYRGNVRFLEQRVDQLVDDFLARVNQKLVRLEAHFTEVQRAREKLLGVASDEGRRTAQLHWRNSLKAVAKQAEDLRKMFSYVLMGLDNKSNFKPVIGGHASSLGYQSEIGFIEEQILKAEQRITDYFFIPTHTVHVEDLRGENMMIHLYRVRKMSEKLSQQW